MKAKVEISKETMDRLTEALDLPLLYDEEDGVDEDVLSYVIELLAEQVCGD